MAAGPDTMDADAARTLFAGGQYVRRAGAGCTPESVLAELERLGFVQLDSINVVERAHHHILWSRLPGYRPAMLDSLQSTGRVFEHWTHDASMIPASLFPHWRHRFSRVESWAWSKWLHEKLGADRDRVLTRVLERVRSEGPLMARDFDSDGHVSGPWWDWKPAKAALEYWWRGGRLAIARREHFHKVYDLTERVLAGVHSAPASGVDEHADWACRSALERLGVATARELAAYWSAIPAAVAGAWCAAAVRRGEVRPVEVASDHGPTRAAYAWADWKERAGRAAEAAGSIPRGSLRLLSPFDPLVRDRSRCLRLFGFDYRFEAFTPEKKRKFGYYVLPILEHTGEGVRLVGRLDPRLDRRRRVLMVRRVWWEAGVRETRARLRALRAALDEYAEFAGARAWENGG